MLEFGEVIAWIYIIFITFFLLFLIYECFRKPSEKPPETAKQEVVHKLYLSECVTRCYEFLDFLSGLGRIELDWAQGFLKIMPWVLNPYFLSLTKCVQFLSVFK